LTVNAIVAFASVDPKSKTGFRAYNAGRTLLLQSNR